MVGTFLAVAAAAAQSYVASEKKTNRRCAANRTAEREADDEAALREARIVGIGSSGCTNIDLQQLSEFGSNGSFRVPGNLSGEPALEQHAPTLAKKSRQ